jgi:hypothetical protein
MQLRFRKLLFGPTELQLAGGVCRGCFCKPVCGVSKSSSAGGISKEDAERENASAGPKGMPEGGSSLMGGNRFAVPLIPLVSHSSEMAVLSQCRSGQDSLMCIVNALLPCCSAHVGLPSCPLHNFETFFTKKYVSCVSSGGLASCVQVI